jgi:molybdenum cofactor cytidylyltransferase
MDKLGSLTVGAIVLAAGSGSRMGNRPKSLLELNGTPLIEHHIKALTAAGVQRLVVVLGHHAAHMARAVRRLCVNTVHNPDPGPDPVSSLRIGLQSLPPTLDAVLVALADQPLITAQDITDLMCAYVCRPIGTQWVQPEVGGLPGNPVMFSSEVRQKILGGNAWVGGPQWRAEHPEQVYCWPSSNTHYRTDIDTPEDIRALLASTGHHLRWPADCTEAPI